jgi:hypothetical protein
VLDEGSGAFARSQVAVGAAGGNHGPTVGAQALRDRLADASSPARDECPAVRSL